MKTNALDANLSGAALIGRKKPELLAPVADMEMCRAAVHNGADAVYVGFPHFNARGRTTDLTLNELKTLIDFCHLHDVRVFLALNILIFENELSELIPTLRDCISLGPDAFILQDLGLARLIRFLAPNQVLHASTQMTVTNSEAITLTEDLDLKRYVLGREVSLDEMTLIRSATSKELEVFVHGALCVSYSGQCLTSESFGGRSANRGQCAQSCRQEYDLIVDGVRKELGDKRYLVSPKDLCGIVDVPRLMDLGIDAFKIEGRLKTPQYVATVTRNYGNAIKGLDPSPDGLVNMELSYSRGFFNGWMEGVNHQNLVDGRYGSHRGVELGKVIKVGRDFLVVESNHPLEAGAGLLFSGFERQAQPRGGRVFAAEALPKSQWRLAFAKDFPFSEVKTGDAAFLNDLPRIENELKRTWTDKSLFKKIPISVHVTGKLNEPLRMEVKDAQGRMASCATASSLQPSRSSPLDASTVRNEMASLGGACYKLEHFRCDLDSGIFLPNRELRKLRQDALAVLNRKRTQEKNPQLCSEAEARQWLDERQTPSSAWPSMPVRPKLTLLLRNRRHVDEIEGLPIDTVYLDFEHGKDYKPALRTVRELGYQGGIAVTRILKPGEYHHLKVVAALKPDVVLVRNLGALEFLRPYGLPLVGDFSLNVSNSLTAGYLLDKSKGLSRLCPSYDLNQWQLLDLLSHAGGKHFEVTVHQYMPSFHMEHCVFAAFLSTGTSFRDCGKPCEHHSVEIRDHTGAAHPLKADQECRNTMFNGKPQSAARLIPQLKLQGVEYFRVEALNENREELRSKVECYAAALQGSLKAEEVFQKLGIVEKYGVMEGQLLNDQVFKDRKKKKLP